MRSSLTESSLLLEIPVPFRQTAQGLWVETQALNGLYRWSDNFDRVTVCAPVIPEHLVDSWSAQWADPTRLLSERNIKFHPLPWGYHPREYFKFRASVKKDFKTLIRSHRYLLFSNIGSVGAWGNGGCDLASAANRPYSIWFDWVLHEMPQVRSISFKGRLKQRFDHHLIKYNSIQAVKNSSLGLFHGKTVYDAYAPHCRQSALVHDVHVKPEDAMSAQSLAVKIEDILNRKTLRIGYVGRLHPMKAPLDWLTVVKELCQAIGHDRVEAVWLGEGELRDACNVKVIEDGLSDVVSFPGYVASREELLKFLKGIDVFLFCHVAPESPRCLLESIISAAPLVGYESEYALDLVGDRGGFLSADIGDTLKLVTHLTALANDRDALVKLTKDVAKSSSLYNDQTVFAHRGELIKKYLP